MCLSKSHVVCQQQGAATSVVSAVPSLCCFAVKTCTKAYFLQVLTFSEDVGPLIRNALIIQLSVERLVLVNNYTQAMQLVRAQTLQKVSIALSTLHCNTALHMFFATFHVPANGQESLSLSLALLRR